MDEIMMFHERWEDFLHDYEFEDARMIYTNGSRLIPSFRVKQMMEHYAPARHGRWDSSGKYRFQIDNSVAARCTECGCSLTEPEYRRYIWNYCPVCGAKMDLEATNE